MLVDSHCHLNFPDFKEDFDDVLKRASDNDIKVMQTICTEMAEFEEVYAIAAANENIYCSVGVHPNNVSNAEIVSIKELTQACSRKKVIGIGETGLDYHYENSARDQQKESFVRHIEVARNTSLPVIIHTRDADEDTIDILRSEAEKGDFKGLIHCFTGTQYLADEAVKMGFYISLSGIITFKNAQSIRDALANVPLERILVETDAPYLAPVPNRGKRNEPAFVAHTNKALAELKDISEAEAARITTENFFKLFDRASLPQGA